MESPAGRTDRRRRKPISLRPGSSSGAARPLPCPTPAPHKGTAQSEKSGSWLPAVWLIRKFLGVFRAKAAVAPVLATLSVHNTLPAQRRKINHKTHLHSPTSRNRKSAPKSPTSVREAARAFLRGQRVSWARPGGTQGLPLAPGSLPVVYGGRCKLPSALYSPVRVQLPGRASGVLTPRLPAGVAWSGWHVCVCLSAGHGTGL